MWGKGYPPFAMLLVDVAPAVRLTRGAIKKEAEILKRLRESSVFKEYQAAFTDVTALSLELRSAGDGEPSSLPFHAPNFCGKVAATGLTCSTCLTLQDHVHRRSSTETSTLRCFAGMRVSLIPIMVGKYPIAYLQTGHVLFQKPTEAGFRRASARIRSMSPSDTQGLRFAYFRSTIIRRDRYTSVIRLLTGFAAQLSVMSNQIALKKGMAECLMVKKARAFISASVGEPLSLPAVAAAACASPFYLCKKFKEATGLTLTEYVARTRVEHVKTAMLNSNTRVSEAAFEAGFQSLSQFNRVFRRVQGESPSEYRESLHPATMLSFETSP